MPALAQPLPVGAEFEVNTVQDNPERPRVASDDSGNFVAVWWVRSQDGDGRGVYGQRYAADGARRGPEFRVNTYTTSAQWEPAVAMDADGDFVVAWQSFGQDGNGTGVYAQRYTAAGVPSGPEFRVNTYTAGQQQAPSVAMNAGGDFVVAWESGSFGGGVPPQDGSQMGVYVQRFTANGVPVGPELQANTYTTASQRYPDVAIDADGDFVVTWSGAGPTDMSNDGVYAQRFTGAGAAVGPEFRVNTYTTLGQQYPSVAMDRSGSFVVAWESFGQDAPGVFAQQIYAQRYDTGGMPRGAEFRVNEATTDVQSTPSVALDADGDFVVAWSTQIVNSGDHDIAARRFTAAGNPTGPEFRVNTSTAGGHLEPSVAADAAGGFVVVWRVGLLLNGPPVSERALGQRYSAGAVSAEPDAPPGFALAVVPNPVGSSGGRVQFTLPEAQHVRLTVTDLLGRELSVPLDGARAAGPHEVTLDTGQLSRGVYLVRVTAGAQTATARLVVVR